VTCIEQERKEKKKENFSQESALGGNTYVGRGGKKKLNTLTRVLGQAADRFLLVERKQGKGRKRSISRGEPGGRERRIIPAREKVAPNPVGTEREGKAHSCSTSTWKGETGYFSGRELIRRVPGGKEKKREGGLYGVLGVGNPGGKREARQRLSRRPQEGFRLHHGEGGKKGPADIRVETGDGEKEKSSRGGL